METQKQYVSTIEQVLLDCAQAVPWHPGNEKRFQTRTDGPQRFARKKCLPQLKHMENSHLFASLFAPQPQSVGLTRLTVFTAVVHCFLVVCFEPTDLK